MSAIARRAAKVRMAAVVFIPRNERAVMGRKWSARGWRSHPTIVRPLNRNQENARRLRQIERGILSVSP